MLKQVFFALMLLTLTLGFAVSAQADKYYVYCANGKIEVDNRNPQQMKSARGSSTYMMSEFNFRSDAEKFAKQLGGIGGSCPKK
ncbi:MAG: hypothetical protein IJU40_07955 [Desulfovibrionaceae bacterium]|nr:hypothetical protein [Desulfovibrionaceae bacterium]